MPSFAKYLLPFAAGVAVGVALHKYWPQIKQAGGPRLEKSLKTGRSVLDRARASFWEKSEQFADLVAEIREEDEAKLEPPEPPAPAT